MTDIPTTDESATDGANRCYRHPDRETFVKCQRCGRPICGQCQTLAPVGVHCPECVREARSSHHANAAPMAQRMGRRLGSSTQPIVTYTIIGLCIVVFVLECLTGLNPLTGAGNSPVELWLAYIPYTIVQRPWTILTVNLVHASILHIASNMYSLFIVGTLMERFLGRARFLAFFVITSIGAVVAVDFFANSIVVGASGAIFGVFGGLLVFARRIGLRSAQIYFVIALNLVIGFVVPGIAWQAHVGGLIVGVALAFLLLRTAGVRRRVWQVLGMCGITVALIAALLVNSLA